MPFETREIVDRIRAGVAARRTAGTAPPRFPLRLSNLARRTALPQARQLSAYRAQRRAEAQQLTADLAQQTVRLEQILRHLPLRDFSTPALLGLIDASAAQPRPPQVRLFRRAGPPPLQPPPPSVHLAEPLHRLRRASNTPTNPNAIHAWLWIGLHVMDLQPSFGHPENLSVAADGAKIVVDISLPDRATYVPARGRAVYTPGDDTIRLQPTKPKEQARLANILFSASLLAHAHAVASTVAAAGLPDTLPMVTNGWEAAINPATGRPDRACRATMITDTRSLATHRSERQRPTRTCLRSPPAPSRTGRPPRSPPQRTTPTERTLDLATIDPYEFERLMTELAQAMGYTAYQTPRSHDHGVDVFVESRDTLAGGRIVISVKRYSHTVGPDHVRALNTVVSDQGAIKGILVTTSSFGPESYRIARDKPLDLIDGEQLREWLREYLGIDSCRRVLI